MTRIFSTLTPGAPHPWRIALLSFLVLALELAFIRQIPAEVRVISYFTNLLLMAVFFGFGLGCILQRWRDLAWLFPVGLLLVFGFVILARGLTIYDGASEVHYWLQYDAVEGTARTVPILPAAIAVFLCAAVPFVALGQALARAMAEQPRLVAYGWDIGGSVAGVLAVALVSALRMPPWILPPALGAGWAVFGRGSLWPRIAAVAAGGLFLWFANTPHDGSWSPYYLVQHRTEELGLRVWVNSSFHQLAIDFTATEGEAGKAAESMTQKFSVPYQQYRDLHDGRGPRRVLVLGAGTGNDVHIALVNGAEHVVAVEIDPEILRLGTQHNAAKPYDDPRVRTVVTDARQFVRSTDETFDLIIVGTLDSQTLLSGQSNLRLENYVYTVESFRDMRRRLAPNGMVAAYYSVFKPWLFGRIYSTVAGAFDGQLRLMASSNTFLFNSLVLAAVGLPGFEPDSAQQRDYATALPATDDWPFSYLEKPTIAPIYQYLGGVLMLLVLLSGLLVRKLYPGTGAHLEFLLLGLGFTLIESAAIVRMALLFGSTWVVNVVVFLAVLVMVFLANRMVILGKAPSLRWAWPGIFAGIALNAVVPLDALLVLPWLPRALTAALLIGVPVYCASVCFSRLFAKSTDVGGAFGMNLVGLMAGGMCEYVSMLIGMRGVWWVAVAVYFAALLWSRRRGGD